MSESDRSPMRESRGLRRRREKRMRAAVRLGGNPLIVGMDLAQKRHAVWLITREQVPLERFMVPHSREALEGLVDRLQARCAADQFDRVLVFMEPTSHFWENVAGILAERGVAHHMVAPLAVKRQREVEHLTYAKGDYRDAELIALLGAHGNTIELSLEGDTVWRRCRGLALEHGNAQRTAISEELRIRALLELALPEYLDYFKDITLKTSRALLRRLSRPASTIPNSYEELIHRAGEVDGHRLMKGKIHALCAKLKASRTLGVQAVLRSSLVRIGFCLDRYEAMSDQLEEIEKRLSEAYQEIPYAQVLDTIPGVSSLSLALLLGLIGDPKRFDHGSCLVKLAGLEPRENESGTLEGSHSISRRGLSDLRRVLYCIVLGLRTANPEFKDHMSRLTSRPSKPLHPRQAMVAAANKFLRLVYRMCVRDEPYDPSRLQTRR